MRKYTLFLLVVLFVATGCNQPEVIHDLGDQNFTLINQDSANVNFPGDFEGKNLVIGFIYTHCPDICPITTANMKNISTQLADTSDVHFVLITFDPQRDTPSVLKNYRRTFKLDEDRFTMLTADPATMDSALAAMNIEAQISFTQTNEEGEKTYRMNHTDRISVMDKNGRIRFEYPGSRVPPEHVIEDLNKIRGEWYEIF